MARACRSRPAAAADGGRAGASVVRLSRHGRMSVAARRYDPRMRYGIALPNFTDVASPEAIEAAAAVAERLGWDAVWTTDHVLVDRGNEAADYRINYDAIETLAWVGARHPSVRLGTSVLVVPQRNAVDPREGAGDARRAVGRPRRSRASASAGTRASSRTSRPTTGSRSAARTCPRRSPCGAISGPARPSRSAAGSTSSTTSRSGRCRRRAPRSRSGSGRGPTRRCGASAASRTATTRRRRARRRTPAGCR